MSDVVLRCPNCGTTQASPGECEACHEAEVRFFCSNHSPGRWLDGPLCADCALRAKEERARRRTPPRSERPVPAPPVDAPRRTPRRPPPLEDWARPREPTEVDLLGEVEAAIGRMIERPPRVRINPAPFLGCLGGLVKLAVVLLILFAMATCWYFGGSGIVIGAEPDARPPAASQDRGSVSVKMLPEPTSL